MMSVKQSMSNPGVRAATAMLIALGLCALLIVGVRSYAIAERESTASWLSAKVSQSVLANTAIDIQSIEKNVANMNVQLTQLRERLSAAADGMKDIEALRPVHAQTLRSLKQVDWQTGLVSSVTASLSKFRAALLRVDYMNQPVGLPDIAALISGGLSGLISYGTFVGIQAGPGIVVGILGSAIGFIFYVCCRPCRCCGQRIPKPTGYTTNERMIPAVLTILCGLTCGLMFMIGYAGSAYFTTGFNDVTLLPNLALTTLTEKITNITTVVQGVSDQVSNIVNSAGRLLDSVSTLAPLIRNLGYSLGNSSASLVTIVDNVEAAANNLTSIQGMLTALTSANITSFPSASTIPSVPTDVRTAISSARDTAQTATAQLNTAIDAVVIGVNFAQNTLIGTLRSLSDTIQGLLTSVTGALNSVVTMANSALGPINDLLGTVRTYQVYRDYAMWGFLGVPCLLWFLGILGALLQNCSTCFSQWMSCCMGFWSCAMFWWIFFLFSLYFMFSILFGDLCEEYVTNASTNLPTLIYNITACPANGNLLSLVGINNITIPDVASLLDISTLTAAVNTSNINTALQPVYTALNTSFTGLMGNTDFNAVGQDLVNRAGNLTVVGLGGPTTSNANTALSNINSITFSEQSRTYVFANVSTMNPSDYTSGNQNTLTANKAIALSYQTLTVLIASVQTNMTIIKDKLKYVPIVLSSADATSAAVTVSLRTSLATASTSADFLIRNATNVVALFTPLSASFQRVVDQFGCGFIATIWGGATTAICTEIYGGATVMWFAFLCIGILLLPQCVLGVLGSTRYGVPEHEPYEDSKAPGDVPMKPLNLRDNTGGVRQVRLENLPASPSGPEKSFAAQSQVPAAYAAPPMQQPVATPPAGMPFYPPPPHNPPTGPQYYM